MNTENRKTVQALIQNLVRRKSYRLVSRTYLAMLEESLKDLQEIRSSMLDSLENEAKAWEEFIKGANDRTCPACHHDLNSPATHSQLPATKHSSDDCQAENPE